MLIFSSNRLEIIVKTTILCLQIMNALVATTAKWANLAPSTIGTHLRYSVDTPLQPAILQLHTNTTCSGSTHMRAVHHPTVLNKYAFYYELWLERCREAVYKVHNCDVKHRCTDWAGKEDNHDSCTIFNEIYSLECGGGNLMGGGREGGIHAAQAGHLALFTWSVTVGR